MLCAISSPTWASHCGTGMACGSTAPLLFRSGAASPISTSGRRRARGRTTSIAISSARRRATTMDRRVGMVAVEVDMTVVDMDTTVAGMVVELAVAVAAVATTATMTMDMIVVVDTVVEVAEARPPDSELGHELERLILEGDGLLEPAAVAPHDVRIVEVRHLVVWVVGHRVRPHGLLVRPNGARLAGEEPEHRAQNDYRRAERQGGGRHRGHARAQL